MFKVVYSINGNLWMIENVTQINCLEDGRHVIYHTNIKGKRVSQLPKHYDLLEIIILKQEVTK